MHNFLPCLNLLLFLVTMQIFSIVISPGCGKASSSSELLNQGASYLQIGEYEKAFREFQLAAQEDPKDPHPLFFQGVALNRIGHPQEALEQLEQSEALGEDHPDLSFEIGWSLEKLGRHQEAIRYFEKYELVNPGRGQTSEFWGRAFYGLKKYDEAVEKLEEALARDPSLRKTVNFNLTLIEAQRKNAKAAVKHYLAVTDLGGEDDPLTVFLQPLFVQKPTKPWYISVSAAGGYNDNVLGLSSQDFLPSDISSQSSPFSRYTLNTQYQFPLTRKVSLFAQYNLIADFYNDIPSFNLLDHSFVLGSRHHLTKAISGSFQINDRYTVFGGDRFRNQIALRPTVAFRWSKWTVTELRPSYSTSNYFLSVPKEQNRDGHAVGVSLVQYIQIPNTDFSANIGWFFIKNSTKGSDFDSSTHGIQAGIQSQLVDQLRGEVYYTRSFDRYDNENSLVLNRFKRKDDIDSISVRTSYPILETSGDWLPLEFSVTLFAQYNYLNINSNIDFLGFNQHAGLGGLITSF
ncbi:MAG: tetratricopeptide repeat protein [Nitrospira sp.]|nr:tetratricopeptide repeat protein [Nitrospira sp.]MCA9475183.1 tetratricopeptide repeat protein [Nitrospira sp.]